MALPLSERTTVALMAEWNRPAAAAVPGHPRSFVTGVGARTSVEGGPESGQLLEFTADGVLRRTFTFEDRVSFGGRPSTGPWAITDFQVEPHQGAPRIAVAAHHYQWWPSLVTVLDETWRRGGRSRTRAGSSASTGRRATG